MIKRLYKKEWDYSLHAKYYEFRPNYNERAIDLLVSYVGAKEFRDYYVADIGAGTGNLTIVLLKRNLNVVAVEPNSEMQKIGINRTETFKNVKWIQANGLNTTLEDESVDWVTFGSSFNVVNRNLALKESYRILKKSGFFSCLWNHRNIEDPIQKIAEDIILRFVPEYDRGVRREDQRPMIEQNSHLFKDIFYLEIDFDVERTIVEYINAWKSVKNKYWDISTTEGRNMFQKITNTMKRELPVKFTIKYTTRAWTAIKTR